MRWASTCDRGAHPPCPHPGESSDRSVPPESSASTWSEAGSTFPGVERAEEISNMRVRRQTCPAVMPIFGPDRMAERG